MSYQIVKCPFCGEPLVVVANPGQHIGIIICPQCRQQFTPAPEDCSRPVEQAIVTQFRNRESPPPQNPAGDWCFCRNCGNKLSPKAYSCPHCGEPVCTPEPPPNYDYLHGGWILGIWACALLLPFPIGCMIVAISASILYRYWRKDYPNKANALNVQSFCAILASVLLYITVGWAMWTILRDIAGL